MKYFDKLQQALEFIRERTSLVPEVGLILGSGLGELAEDMEQPVFINYNEIPYFPTSRVAGHKNRLVFGTFNGKKVVAMQGRIHYYEGYSIQDIVFPIRLMKLTGIKNVIVTNAAGGINRDFKPGDLMLITDHINFLGVNPLMGDNVDELGTRFPDMTYAYDVSLQKMAERIAGGKNIDLKKGVYAASIGPSYETKAEVMMLARLGADAVGMSTVPETIAANHMAVHVLGISCITNMAAGILPKPLDHSEVIEVTERVKEKFKSLVSGLISAI